MIRQATPDDIPALVRIGKHFADYSPFGVEYSPDGTSAFLHSIITQYGVVFVSEYAGEIVGLIVGMLAPIWYSPRNIMATEVAWWVVPEHRGGSHAVKLAKEFEKWGITMGASHICFSDLCIKGEYPAGSMLGRMGYTPTERSHVKGVS